MGMPRRRSLLPRGAGQCLEATAARQVRHADGFFFVKQKTAYEVTEGDWSSDVCSSDLVLTYGAGSLPMQVRPESKRSAMSDRSEERRVGKECPQLCRSRWPP